LFAKLEKAAAALGQYYEKSEEKNEAFPVACRGSV
jgi:hypothetical protein